MREGERTREGRGKDEGGKEKGREMDDERKKKGRRGDEGGKDEGRGETTKKG